jgi:hypothetical protein
MYLCVRHLGCFREEMGLGEFSSVHKACARAKVQGSEIVPQGAPITPNVLGTCRQIADWRTCVQNRAVPSFVPTQRHSRLFDRCSGSVLAGTSDSGSLVTAFRAIALNTGTRSGPPHPQVSSPTRGPILRNKPATEQIGPCTESRIFQIHSDALSRIACSSEVSSADDLPSSGEFAPLKSVSTEASRCLISSASHFVQYSADSLQTS